MPIAPRSEREVLSFILAFHMKHGEYPSQRLASKSIPMALSTVNKMYSLLANLGLIKTGAGGRIIWAGMVSRNANSSAEKPG